MSSKKDAWGLKVEPKKRYSTTVEKRFILTKAILDKDSPEDEFVSLVLEDTANPYILCNLNLCLNQQEKLDITFEEGDKITFYSLGSGIIYLLGHFVNGENVPSDSSSEEDEPVIRIPKKPNPSEQVKVKEINGKKLRVGGPTLKADLSTIKPK